MGLDPTIVDRAIADPTTHDDVRSDHDAVIAAGGYGVPTLCFEQPADEGISTDADGPHQDWLFGPVVLDPPTGDAALRLWSAVTAWLEFPHLYELQRPKTVADGLRTSLGAKPFALIRRHVDRIVTATEAEILEEKDNSSNLLELTFRTTIKFWLSL